MCKVDSPQSLSVCEGAGLAGEGRVGAEVSVDLEESLLAETTFGKVAEGAGETEPGFAHGLGDVLTGESIEGGRGERSQGQTVGHKEVSDDGVGAVRTDESTFERERFAEQR